MSTVVQHKQPSLSTNFQNIIKILSLHHRYHYQCHQRCLKSERINISVVKRCKYERATVLGPSYCRRVQCSCSQSRRRRPARRTWSTCDPATCSTRTHGTCSPARLDNNNSLLLTLIRTQHQLSSPLHSIHYMVCSVHVQPIIVITTIIMVALCNRADHYIFAL